MNTPKSLIASIYASILLFCCAGLLSAQIVANPSPLTFTALPNGASPASQTTTISNATSGASVVITNVFSATGWLSPGLTPVSYNATTATFSVGINTAALPVGFQPGSQSLSGAITFSDGSTSTSVTVYVNPGTSTSGASVISASVPSLTFSAQTGTTPFQQTVAVSTLTGTTQGFSAQATTANGLSWLTANATVAEATPSSQGSVVVQVSQLSMPVGTYTGTVTLIPTTSGAAQVVISVTYTITSQPLLSVTPTSLSFYYQTGTSTPAFQYLSLTSTGADFAFCVNFTSSGGQWLQVTPTLGLSTPAQLTAYINTSAIPASVGTYSGSIVIAGTNCTTVLQTIPVTFQVSNYPLLSAAPTALSFNMAGGGALPASTQLSLTSTGAAIAYTVTTSVVTPSGNNWLAVSPASGSTSAGIVTASINSSAQNLLPGTYTANITFAAPLAGNSPALSVPVSLTVTNTAQVTAFPPALTFNWQTTQGGPNSQSITVSSTGAPQTFSAGATVTTPVGGSWLTVSPSSATTSSAPNVTVGINTTGLSPGNYAGSVVITPSSTGVAAVTIPVTLNVSTTTLINVAPGALAYTFTTGGTTFSAQSLGLAATDSSAVNVTLAQQPVGVAPCNNSTPLPNPGSSLLFSPTAQTPNNVPVYVSATGLLAGVYNACIMVSAPSIVTPGPVNQYVPVVVTVTNGAALSANPASLTFTQVANGPVPATQTVAVSTSVSSLGFSVQTTSGGLNWLTVTQSSNTTPASLSVNVNGASLSPGTYNGTIAIAAAGASNSPLNIPVTLTVAAQPTLSVTPTSLQFSYQLTGTAPAAQSFTAASNGASVTVSASVTSGTWLSVSPASGATPASFSASVNPAGLAVGSYTGTIAVKASDAANSPNVTVTLTVTAPPPGALTAIENAASYASGAIAPGEIITLFGTNIGPATPAYLTLTSSNAVATNIGNTQVLFDGLAAPMIYASSNQISAIVPYEIAGRLSTNVAVSFDGVSSNVLTMQVTASAPAIFSLNQAGNGQGAILDQNYTLNGSASPAVPAAKGSVVQVFATGEGQTNPPGVTGSITGTVLHQPLLAVSATVAGIPATIQYAGSAPDLVAGVLQVNVVIPPNAPSGNDPLVITVGTTSTQSGITVAVQ
jgi:uncharacterized protein (TIGR03437 family)